MLKLFGMECLVCGEDLFVRSENVYQEGEHETCQNCGCVHWISIDEDVAYASTDERAEDKGQARCDGSDCGGGGAIKEFHGTPCRWDCKRVTEPKA